MSQDKRVGDKAFLAVPRMEPCPACRGTKLLKDADGKNKPCNFCNGTGLRHKAGYSTK